jgi:riboflavin synthase
MFTGLIQGLGQTVALTPYQLAIDCSSPPPPFLQAIALGDSIAVDGVCLTVEAIRDGGFVASVSPETLARTTLGGQSGRDRWVNLEPSLRVGDKIGGHFVTGHVDGLGHLVSAAESATSWTLIFSAPASLTPYLVAKGSIAVNGISLTIAACSGPGAGQGSGPESGPESDGSTQFTVAVIPHSYAQTNLQALSPGDPVNLEGDVLSKYVGQLLASSSGGTGPLAEPLGTRIAPPWNSPAAHSPDDLSPEFLSEHGYS